MKTKRKLDPKSNPHTGDCNVVPLDVADRVLDVNSNAPAKRQRANGSGFISPLLIDVGPSGVQNVAPVGEPALPTTGISHCTLMSSSCGALPATGQTLSHSVIPTTVTRQPMEIDESSGDATHVVRVDNYSSRCPCSGMQSPVGPRIEHHVIWSTCGAFNLVRSAKEYSQEMFSMTSLGANVDESINNGRGPYVFKISGQLYHWIGSLCPADGEPPRFLQLYIYDTDNEVDNRLTHFGGDNSVLRRDIVEGLIDLLDSHNALVQLFRTAREKLQDTHVPNFKVMLYNVIGVREYELPTGDMLGTIVYEAGPENNMDYDIVLEEHGKYWRRRRLRNKSSIERLAYVHPTAGDLFYQRMLLCHQKGCTSFRGIRTVNEVVYPTCRDACEALGLLQDDQEWEITLQEAALTATPAELRTLLAHILAYCEVSNPKRLWERTWKSMSEDIPYVCSISLNLPNLHIEDSDLEDYMLYEFKSCLNRCSKSVTDFGLHLPPEHLMSVLRNKLLMEEKSYDRRLLAIERDKLLPMLNEKQHEIFDLIVNACLNNEQQLVFVYGHGGTGKTFLWKTILHTLRSEQKIVLAVASSGIASLLLPAGRTAHSRFKIPLDLTDTSVCSIRKHTQLADLLKETCLIVWDESPMNDRRCFETLDRTLRDILDQPNHLFGGKTVMLGGDFRQTLPVKRGASRNEIIRYSIANSYLWPHFKIHYLTENMRLSNKNLSEVDKHRTAVFAQWLLDIGNGRVLVLSLMATTSYPDTAAKNKGKMVAVQPEISDIASLKPTDSNKVIETTKYEAMEKPIVIAVSSCWVKAIQRSTFSISTHYYLNPNIPETYHIKEQCQQLNDATPILNIDNQRYEDLEEEKNRNRFPLATLLEVDPQNYQHVRFTSDAIIYKISTQNKWYYERCTACGKQVIPGNPVPTCKNHGPQPTPTHSYCFKAIIGDGSGTIPVTCFSNQANALVKDCNELLTELSTRNPYELPSILKDLEGTARIFQFHFEINSTSKRKDFVLDKVFEKTMLPLPAPPIQNATVEHITTEQPKPVALLETSSPTLSTTGSNEFNLQENITDPLQQSPTTRPPPEHSTKDQEENEPTDLPALVTKETTYNVNLRADMPKFDTQEAPTATPIEFQPSQSTPPQIENPIEADKEKPPTNTTRASARKSLFIDTPETHSPQAGKKSKRNK
ncbi:DNA helicase [Tanacetum coccineum]|uniref:ATP-dependent DNA helicase n=1 Tax=Tanacetum coccineum TaxID=301880 RepID=A0ABQ4Z177_9ASTR